MKQLSISLFLSIFLLSACAQVSHDQSAQPEDKPKLTLERASFEALAGWARDDLRSFVPAFQKSCGRILKGAADKKMGALEAAGSYGDWQVPCRAFAGVNAYDSAAIRAFFEHYFTPHAVRADDEPQGMFTGYYEASLKGSRVRSETYNVPLYQRSDDLVMVQLGDFRNDLKGRRIAGRVVDGRLKPYESRAEIVGGDWPHNDEVLVWVDSAVDAFFVQIQGSGIVELEDGEVMRIGYAGQNGHPYYAIGRELIKRGDLTKENVSMQSIRAWLEANPHEADDVMNSNASYVFFKALEGEGPLGGEGVALTAGRSLAIDRSLLAYGLPLWVDIDPPLPNEMPRLQKMMMAQDTGGAIRGPVRGDVFWGHGAQAETLAGPMKSQGRYWVLLPR